MGQFYIDDSVHDKAGFIVGACIYTESDLAEEIKNVITANGHDPNFFEYKSCRNYSKQPSSVAVRSGLKGLLSLCKLAIVIVPRAHRDQIGFECIKALKTFIEFNEESISYPINISFDQGMFTSVKKAQFCADQLEFKDCHFFWEQNSLSVPGIQMADLAAHTASIQLKERMGLVRKMVKAGENSGYVPDLEIELGFEMRATLRYAFFRAAGKGYQDPIKKATLPVEPNGLYISPLCNDDLAAITRECFGNVYLGCIH